MVRTHFMRWMLVAVLGLVAMMPFAGAVHVPTTGKFTQTEYVAGEVVHFKGETSANAELFVHVDVCRMDSGCAKYGSTYGLARVMVSPPDGNGLFSVKFLTPNDVAMGDQVRIYTIAFRDDEKETVTCTGFVKDCHGYETFYGEFGNGARLWGKEVAKEVVVYGPWTLVGLIGLLIVVGILRVTDGRSRRRGVGGRARGRRRR